MEIEQVRKKMYFTDRIRIDNSEKKYGRYEIADNKVKVHLTNKETSKTKSIQFMRKHFGMRASYGN